MIRRSEVKNATLQFEVAIVGKSDATRKIKSHENKAVTGLQHATGLARYRWNSVTTNRRPGSSTTAAAPRTLILGRHS